MEHDERAAGEVPGRRGADASTRSSRPSGRRPSPASIVPVLCGASFKNKGVQALLDAVIDYLPSPMDIPPIQGHLPLHDDTHIERCASDDEPFSALAFKIATDPFVGPLTFFRVYSGSLKCGQLRLQRTKDKRERIGRLLQMHANKREEIEEVLAGDIAAAIGLKDTRTGDTLSDEDKPIILEAMKFPNPVIDVAIEPKTKADQDKLAIALQKLPEEDPDVPGAHRRGDRPDDHRRHGRAAPRDHRRPHEARVQGRGQRRQAAGGLPGDDPEEGRPTSRASSSASRAARASTATWSSTSSRPSRAAGFVFEDKIVGGVIPREFIKPVEAGHPGGAGERRAGRLSDGGRQGDADLRLLPRRRLAKWRSRSRARWRSRKRRARRSPVHPRADDGGRSGDPVRLHGRRARRPLQPRAARSAA